MLSVAKGEGGNLICWVILIFTFLCTYFGDEKIVGVITEPPS